MLFEQTADDGAGLLIETFPDGWWHGALPDNRRIVAVINDTDLFAVEPQPARWIHARSAQRSAAAPARAPIGSPVLRPAGSRHVTRDTTLPLLCVGDAASCFDPVSGQGIFKALRSGIFASYSVGDLLCRADDSGLRRYRRFIADEFLGYRGTLLEYYGQERRWAERPFWRRRIADNLATNSAAPMEAALS